MLVGCRRAKCRLPASRHRRPHKTRSTHPTSSRTRITCRAITKADPQRARVHSDTALMDLVGQALPDGPHEGGWLKTEQRSKLNGIKGQCLVKGQFGDFCPDQGTPM